MNNSKTNLTLYFTKLPRVVFRANARSIHTKPAVLAYVLLVALLDSLLAIPALPELSAIAHGLFCAYKSNN
jgi:hypothetical protein